MVAFEHFLLYGLIGLFLLFSNGQAVGFLILFAPWACLMLEHLTAPFLAYDIKTLVFLFIAETSTRVWSDISMYGWEDFDFGTNIREIILDIMYKWTLFDLFGTTEESM